MCKARGGGGRRHASSCSRPASWLQYGSGSLLLMRSPLPPSWWCQGQCPPRSRRRRLVAAAAAPPLPLAALPAPVAAGVAASFQRIAVHAGCCCGLRGRRGQGPAAEQSRRPAYCGGALAKRLEACCERGKSAQAAQQHACGLVQAAARSRPAARRQSGAACCCQSARRPEGQPTLIRPAASEILRRSIHKLCKQANQRANAGCHRQGRRRGCGTEHSARRLCMGEAGRACKSNREASRHAEWTGGRTSSAQDGREGPASLLPAAAAAAAGVHETA